MKRTLSCALNSRAILDAVGSREGEILFEFHYKSLLYCVGLPDNWPLVLQLSQRGLVLRSAPTQAMIAAMKDPAKLLPENKTEAAGG